MDWIVDIVSQDFIYCKENRASEILANHLKIKLHSNSDVNRVSGKNVMLLSQNFRRASGFLSKAPAVASRLLKVT